MGRVSEEKRRSTKIREERKSQKKEDAGAREGRKVTNHCVFPMICGSGGSKSRLAKAAGAEPAGQMRDEKMHAVFGAQHISKSKCTKHTKFGPLLEVEMSKTCTRCGAIHISKSKCTKHFSFGALLKVALSKKCTPLWREAHVEVKMYKAHHVRATFGRSDVLSRGRRKGLRTFSKVSKNVRVLWHFQKRWQAWDI